MDPPRHPPPPPFVTTGPIASTLSRALVLVVCIARVGYPSPLCAASSEREQFDGNGHCRSGPHLGNECWDADLLPPIWAPGTEGIAHGGKFSASPGRKNP